MESAMTKFTVDNGNSGIQKLCGWKEQIGRADVCWALEVVF